MPASYRLSFFALSLAFLIVGCAPRMPHLHRIAEYHLYEDAMDVGLFSKYIIIEPTFSEDLKEGLREVELLRFQKAGKYLDELPEEESLFLGGVICLEQKKYEDALLFFDELYRKHPSHTQAGLLVLDCQLRMDIDRDYWKAYQALYDNCTDDVLCNLVEIRFRYKQHGMY